MWFSRQEYWSGLPCLSLGDLPDPGIEPASPASQAGSLWSEPPGKPIILNNTFQMSLGWVCFSFNLTDEGLAYKLHVDIHLSLPPHILCRLDNGTVLQWNWHTLPWSIKRIGNSLSCFAEEEGIFIYCTLHFMKWNIQISLLAASFLPQRCPSFSNNVYATTISYTISKHGLKSCWSSFHVCVC